MMKAFQLSSCQPFNVVKLVSQSQLRQGRICQGQFRNFYTNRSQQYTLLNHSSKVPRIYRLPPDLAISRWYSFKSALNYARWTVHRIFEHFEQFVIKTPFVDIQGKFLKPGSIVQFKPILPQLPKHLVIERPQEMKKLKEAYQYMEKRKLEYQPEVIYLKGEPGVGKTQLARMFAEDYYEGMNKTDAVVATIDMTDFSNNYRKFAIRLGIDPDLADGLPLKRVAEEMKMILAEKKKKWLLIIDNYNSTQQLGFERDDLERNLIPLHGLTVEWGNGKVLVTTSNAGVIPQNNTVSIVGIEPLSIEESAKLIGTLAGYNLAETEKESLEAAVDTKQWRCLPLVMARIGEYICMRRKQTADYNFDSYVKELEKGEAKDPLTSIQNIYLPVQTMMTSPALKLAFRLLALCPENSKVPLVLFERLMKKYFREEWAQRLRELESCTIITVEHESELPKQRDVKPKFLTVHKLHQQAMFRVMQLPPAGFHAYQMNDTKSLITDFVNSIIAEYEEACASSDSIHAMKMPHILFKLLTGLDQINDEFTIFPPDVKVNVDCVLSDAHLRLKAQPREALEKLKPYYDDNRLGPESDDISINIVIPEGLVTDDVKTALATKVYLHLGKIFREQGEYHKASKVLMTALQPFYCQTSNSDLATTVLKEKAKLALILGDYGVAKDHLNEVLQLYKDEEPTLKAEVHTLLGKVYSKQFVCEEAEKHYKKALQISAETKIPTILAADVEMNLGDICSDQGNYKKALEHLEKSQKMLAKVRDSNQAQELFLPIAIRFTKMALCHLYSGRTERADKEAEWALSTTSKLPWTQNSALYSWLWGLQRVADVNRLLKVQKYIEDHPADYVPERLKFVRSKMNYIVGNVKEAEQLMREFIFNTNESDVDVLAKTAFNLKHPLRELGMMYFHLGEYQQSLNVLNRARELQEQTKLPDNHSEVCFVKAHLGRIHYEAGNKRGLQMTQEAVQNLEMNPILSGHKHLDLLWWTKAQRMRPFRENHKNLGLHLKHSAVLTLHGMLLNENCKWSDARDVLKKALVIRETLLCPNNIYTARTIAALGMAEYHLEKRSKGKRLLSKAAKMTNMSNQFYPRHILGAYVHLTYAQVLKEDGDLQEAAKQAKNAIECIDYACQTDTHPTVAECHLLLASTMQSNISEQRYHLIKAHDTYSRLIDRETKYCKRQGLDPSSVKHLKTWHKLKMECNHRLKSSQ